MFKFTTATLLAAGAAAVSLGTKTHLTDDLNPDRLDGIFGRTEDVHEVLDADNDGEISVTEIANVILMAENSQYINHEIASSISLIVMHLFWEFGETISLGEVQFALAQMMINKEMAFPSEHVLILVELMEYIMLEHGFKMDFYEALDTNNNS